MSNEGKHESEDGSQFDWMSDSDKEVFDLIDDRLFLNEKAQEIESEIKEQAIKALNLTENQIAYVGLLHALYLSGLMNKDAVVDEALKRIKDMEDRGETDSGEYVATKAFLISTIGNNY